MKQHTSDFKNEIKKMGRKLYDEVTYTKNNQEIVLHNELYRVDPHYEGNLLKSVMKELEIESSVEIEKDTIVNYRMSLLVNGQYEYINYGNYIVYNVEKIEDSDKYKITCYDKMLYFMKNYENMNITYPISLRDYINRLVQYAGLTFANRNSTFANYNRMIQSELYLDSQGNDIGYTFRDVLDEIAQATGSIVCINNNDEVEIRYITNTNDYIDENYLKDVNVKFGEKYGPVNSIVLSRSGESDNVYTNNPQSIEENGLTEIKIVDNQLMNWNDRADYLNDLASVLMNLEYYINDFSSTGILYYELGDRYSVYIGENSYSCVMLNDEVERKDGLQELIHTDMPEETETDYTKADKDDRKINRTYLLVDKQNQKISSVVSQVTEQNSKISQINQRVDEISSQISDIADITTYGESSYAEVELNDINTSEPIMLKVHPIVNSISYLYPFNLLYPSNSTFMNSRIVRFENTEKYIVTSDRKYTAYKQYFSYNSTTEVYTLLVAGTDYNVGDNITGTVYEHKYVDYELPDDLLMYSQDVYDEFYLDYNSHTCQVTKRCAYNADGTVSELQSETTTDYEYPTIELEDGNYKISILGYQYGYIYVRLMAKNVYTDQFYTKSETNTLINQTANDITLSVNQTLTNYSTTSEMNSAINIKAGEITSTVASTYETKTSATQKYSQLQQTDSQISSTVATKVGNNEVISKINQSAEAVTINANKISLDGKTINLTSGNIAITSSNFNVDKNGNMTCNNANISGTITSSNATITGGKIKVQGTGGATDLIRVENSNNPSMFSYIQPQGAGFIGSDISHSIYITAQGENFFSSAITIRDDSGYTYVGGKGITTPYVEQTSLETEKKNFEKLKNALEIIKNIDIYKYNLKTENDDTKKHIGFVIGDNYNYSKELTSNENTGVDIYSFVAVCCQAIQEQQEQIEKLKKEINKLKEEK